jgi:NADH:ubiquinone oxidoreductase subunit F (NADH-binding)
MILALRCLGAREGFICVRHEYPAQIEALRDAVAEAEAILRGRGTFGTVLPFRIEIVESPGGYICGEQSALLEALEGQRAQPRLRNSATDIQRNGLYGQPTILNNVETMAWVPAIALQGWRWYASQGHHALEGDDEGRPVLREDRYKGLRFFSISGDVERPGVYEVPIGSPLRELVEGCAGGMREGRELRAVAPSGPSGGFLPAEFARVDLRRRLEEGLTEARGNNPRRLKRFIESLAGEGRISVLDLELASPLFRAMGSMLGAGIVVLDASRDLVGLARNATEFFRNESCGKCVPCRLGTQQFAELAGRLDQGGYSRVAWQSEGAEELIGELGQSMELTSICSLGKAASNPLKTLVENFHEDIDNHLSSPNPAGRPGPGASS